MGVGLGYRQKYVFKPRVEVISSNKVKSLAMRISGRGQQSLPSLL